MTNLIIQDIEKQQVTKDFPELRPGTTVRVHQRIKEGNKERTQVFEGLIIAASHGAGINHTITVRKVVEGIGVEKIFPLYMPTIEKIEIVRIGKVRRSKLYYMREISGKAARLKERIGEKKKLMEAMGVKLQEREAAEKALADEEAKKEAEAAKLAEEQAAKEAAEAKAATQEEAPAEAPAVAPAEPAAEEEAKEEPKKDETPTDEEKKEQTQMNL